ncbi:hypothetical protein [Streptomyces spectabilis]|uniref:CHAD domain-containing protein n=1 Tax=Streptomyces spectabilis TaxID=68270 RepID=A0A7W8B114_STRST|nr:hypothetical protein [Streptomyces spectabilis]MBB5108333.1 hypothetical protein [Streptomyces spectabilis]MCI3901091.1 hypothetical protein [Streptomyces spectabilis]
MQALIGDRRVRAERRRAEFVAAVRGVLRAYVRFRGRQYMKIRARRLGRDDTDESLAARYAARDALTEAIDYLYTATADQRLLAAAEEARELVVALGDAASEPGAVDEDAVAEIGRRARESHSALRQMARRALYG